MTIAFALHPCHGWIRIIDFHCFSRPICLVQRVEVGEA